LGHQGRLFGPPFWPLAIAQSHIRAAAVLFDELDASLPRQPNWVGFVNSKVTALWFRRQEQESPG
jgi:hypothetical protein